MNRYSNLINKYSLQNLMGYISNPEFTLIKLVLTSPDKYLVVYQYSMELYF